MSASLVGSEMCIRDRSSISMTPSRTDEVVTPSRSERRSPAALTSSTSTVSYTHLTLPTICSV
eukprot:13853794-Alexandrium_andersonii.AAC.1